MKPFLAKFEAIFLLNEDLIIEIHDVTAFAAECTAVFSDSRDAACLAFSLTFEALPLVLGVPLARKFSDAFSKA